MSLVAGTPYGQLPDPYLTGIFMAGTLLTRGAGCTINDIWDHKLDAKVERCKTRPIPAGEVSVQNAKIWFVTQMSAAFGLLFLLNPTTFYLGLAAPIPIMLYPLAKQTSIPERFKYTKEGKRFRNLEYFKTSRNQKSFRDVKHIIYSIPRVNREFSKVLEIF